jgi:hypothetical protein
VNKLIISKLPPAQLFILSCVTFFATLGLLVLLEFKLITIRNLSSTYVLLSTLCTFGFLYQLPRNLKNRLLFFSKLILFCTGALIAFHLLTNSFNIYNTLTLPNLFYQLKLHRIVSLSANFLVQLITLVVGLQMVLQFNKSDFKLKKLAWYQALIAGYLFIVLVIQSQQAVAVVYRDALQAAVNTNTSFENRIAYRLGGSVYYGWIWPYTQFIIRHTEPDSVIAIPPQSVVWKMEGNSDYLRWYIYPRKTVKQLTDYSIPANADYALIAIGECNVDDCGWPKTAISKEKIEYIALLDRETQKETIITNTDYVLDPKIFTWGIIKFRK